MSVLTVLIMTLTQFKQMPLQLHELSVLSLDHRVFVVVEVNNVSNMSKFESQKQLSKLISYYVICQIEIE